MKWQCGKEWEGSEVVRLERWKSGEMGIWEVPDLNQV